MPSRPYALLCFVALLAGCFNDPPAAPPDADPQPDAPADTTVDDLPPPDAPPEDSAAPDAPDDLSDAPSDAPPDAPPCATDRDCTDPAQARCLTAAGRCVRCLTSDDCARGQRCDPARNTCEAGCAADADCRRGADDAGLVSRCDTARGQCVECSTDDECPVRTICTEGTCVPGCNERRGCSTGETCCRNACSDLARDTANCGACGARCDAPNATTACAMGRCAIAACNAGFADCDGDVSNGCEARLTDDAHNCGRCGTTCLDVDNAAVACSMGRCGFTCRAGYADCDGDGDNGCERNLDADPTSCGRCGAACPTPAGAQAVLCAMGTCGFSCRPGLGNCDGDASNGCETELQTAAAHCGACGNACPAPPHTTATCEAGRCGTTCETGWGDCDGDATNGCETDLATAVEHCGRCGHRCAVPGGTAACVAGACTVAACGTSFADCDMSAANGCETDLRSTPAHCGACTTACPARPHAEATCDMRACGSRCAAGWSDCDGDASNGCEADTRTDPRNCGACGRACTAAHGTPGCSAGACTLATCDAGWGDCDGAAATGCETDLTRTPSHCGACGVRGVEACDGRDNSCDGRVDEGCPTGLAGLDAVSATSPTYGSTSGSPYDLACPPGTFATGVTGRLYLSFISYQTQWLFRCARPRLVEDTSRTPYAYRIEWTDAGTAGPVGAATGSTYTFNCAAGSVIHRVAPYASSVVGQVTWECASWSLAGSAATGWRVARSVTNSGTYGRAIGTRYDYTCPDSGGNAAALRGAAGRVNGSYISSVALRCASPSVTVR